MKFLLLFFQGFLFENYKYTIDLVNIIGFALTNILSTTYIFNITRSDILLPILFVSRI
jgi:hypothetical protein